MYIITVASENLTVGCPCEVACIAVCPIVRERVSRYLSDECGLYSGEVSGKNSRAQ